MVSYNMIKTILSNYWYWIIVSANLFYTINQGVYAGQGFAYLFGGIIGHLLIWFLIFAIYYAIKFGYNKLTNKKDKKSK